MQASGASAEQLPSDEEEGEKSTLSEMLRAVKKCTASFNTLKEPFGGLKEEVGLIRQDLQKKSVQQQLKAG